MYSRHTIPGLYDILAQAYTLLVHLQGQILRASEADKLKWKPALSVVWQQKN